MTLALAALPLLVLVALLASGRVSALASCGAALVAAVPALLRALGPGDSLAGLLGRQSLQALWLAIAPVGIIAGGLLFHEATRRPSGARAGADLPDLMFTAGFLFGPFSESVTGFGVGAVFAISALTQAGVGGAAAVAIAQFAEMLIPWGGLGPGTAVGAALAEVPAQAIATRNAFQAAAWMLALLPLFWRLAAAAGHPVPSARRPAQALWVATAGALLIACHYVLPWEVAGVLATGPLLALKLWHADPPRDRAHRLAAARTALPYLLLTGALLGSRLWPAPPSWQPFPALPALPVNHPLVAMWGVALAVLTVRARDPLVRAGAALRRARRPALTVLLYVLLARWLVGAGVPGTLAQGLEAALGGVAPYASPLLAAGSGFFIGTNVGSNSAMMPLQAALGRLYALPPALLPSVQNFVGAACMIMAPALVAITSGLAGGGVRPEAVWRLAWPVFAIAIAIGLASVAIG